MSRDLSAGKLFDVRGLVTIVTGGASGIGLGLAEVMAANGAQVVVLDFNAATLDVAIHDLCASGAKVEGQVLDVTDRARVDTVFDAIAAKYGRIDVVFANAGVGGGPGFLAPDGTRLRALEQIPDEHWDPVIDVNLSGAFNTVRAAARIMKSQSSGRIVVTTSAAVSKTEHAVGMGYTVSKAAAAQLVRQAALELARYGITVNAIAPGPCITNISGGRLKDPTAQLPFARANPMHRMALPEDMQGVALLLASPAGSYITGTQVNVDGGYCLGTVD